MATTLREGVDIINESLATLGYDFKIDTTSNTTMTEGLEKIGAFPPSQRNILMEQMNLVIQQRNFGVIFDSAKNKFRAFLVDMSPDGFGIEDVFHELLNGTATLWDGNATSEEIYKDLVEYKNNDVQKFFHTKSNSRKFDTTVDRRNYEKVFTPYGVTRYVDTRLANLSWSAEYWLMQRAISIISDMAKNDKTVYLGNLNVNSKDGINETVETIKSVTAGFRTPTAIYNKGYFNTESSNYTPVINMTDSDEDIFIVCTPEFMSRIKTYGYSNAFNLSQYELEGRIMYAPAGTDFGTAPNGEKILAVILDRRAILLGIHIWMATSFFVANTGWMNHFLNVEILEGYNTIFNCVALTGEAIDSFFNGNTSTVVITGSVSVMNSIITDGVTVSYDSNANFENKPIKTISNVSKITLPTGFNTEYMKFYINGTSISEKHESGSINGINVTDDPLEFAIPANSVVYIEVGPNIY